MKCDYDNIAEAWILSAHPDGQSTVASGKHAGLFLSQYIDTVGKDVLGWKCSHLEDFPLLIKLIDAAQDLSVQVHPDDDYAMANESQYGKNEMWYVIDCEEGSGLYVGFNKDVTEDELRSKIADGTVTEIKSHGDPFTQIEKCVLLINGNTASAAEVFTLAMKERTTGSATSASRRAILTSRSASLILSSVSSSVTDVSPSVIIPG